MLALHPVLDGLDAPFLVIGSLDWIGHLATAVIVVGSLPVALRTRALVAALAASLLIDLDHLPQYLGTDVLTDGTARPYGHTLTAVLVAVAAALALRGRAREVAAGVTLGVLVHLLRDVASGPGISPLWPLSDAVARVPFWLEAALLAVLAARAWYRAAALPQVTR